MKEIRESIGRCTYPAQISHEAARLAAHFSVSKSRIYEVTKDLRPPRKTRTDKGKRVASLLETEGLKYAAALVVEYQIDPAEAVRTARERDYDVPISLATFERYLREHGLNRRNRRTNRKNYRRFEAASPGDVFQFDISGSKERWYDVKTRRIVQVSNLEVSKNHANENKNRTRVWRFVLVDDFSRRKFIRYVCCDKPNSSHVVSFLLDAFQEMGVPKILYTDNDRIIKYGRNQRAAQILNKALEEVGGYRLLQHEAGNARATGKVEVAHQQIEKFEKLLGLLIAEGRAVDLDVLDRFARRQTLETNHKIHRTTGEKPIDRWNSRRHLVRTIDAKLLRAAFLVDEFPITINGDLTFAHRGVLYQLPPDRQLENLIARQSRSHRCRIIVSDELDFFTLVDFDGSEYDIAKTLAAPDAFGEFNRPPADVSEKTRKILKAHAKEKARAAREIIRQNFQPPPIPIIDTDYAQEKSNVAQFPQASLDVTRQILEALPAANRIAAEASGAGRLLNFWDAVRQFKDDFASIAACKEFLDTIFSNREDDAQPEDQIYQRVEAFFAQEKEMPPLRRVN